MKRITIGVLLLGHLLLGNIAYSQVTIGSGIPPIEGAILDIKEVGFSGDSGTATASKGVVLPRVVLTTMNPAIGQLAQSIGSTGTWDEKEHIGLMIYNVKGPSFDELTCITTGAPIGLYVWYGANWQRVSPLVKDPLEAETSSTLTDREGNVYSIAQFGYAGVWMTENLRTTKAPGNIPLTENATNGYTQMYYAYPQPENDDYKAGKPALWKEQYGLVYNWYATMNKVACSEVNQGQGQVDEQTEIIQGICPYGWHIPSDKEFNQLEEVIAAEATAYTKTPAQTFDWEDSYSTSTGYRPNGGDVFGQGKSMKSTTALNGVNPNGDSKAANKGGFNVLLVGFAAIGTTSGFGNTSYFWTSSSYGNRVSYQRQFEDTHSGITRAGLGRTNLLSIRCKKD